MKAYLPQEAFQLVNRGEALLIDISSDRQFAQAHPKNAINLPYTANGLQAGQVEETLEKPWILFGRIPAVARSVAESLAPSREIMGYLDVGLEGWQAAGLPVEGVGNITPDELHARLQKGEPLTVIDVREPYEWRSGVIEGALKIPMGQIPSQLASIPKDRPVVVVCASGNRSATVATFLHQQGYPRVMNLAGGMSLWIGAQHPVVRIP
ncbi:MAG: hypothetical protein IMW91_09415 [Firmicutes bacterium]|nr:hypothetical protein [Bacillota bacterium]